VLRAIADLWEKQPDRIARSADEIVAALRAGAAQASLPGEPLDASLLSQAAEQLKLAFDPAWGGFGGPPKFPDTGAIVLLLRQHLHTGDAQLLEMATATLDHMAYGGIHDQLGGGFHRYTVDGGWQTPHFEKMLYDNALLAETYLEAWQAAGKDLHRRTAADTLDYVLREMNDREAVSIRRKTPTAKAGKGSIICGGPTRLRPRWARKTAASFAGTTACRNKATWGAAVFCMSRPIPPILPTATTSPNFSCRIA